MLEGLTIWGLSGWYAIGLIISGLLAMQYFTSWKIPLLSSIVSTKRASGAGALILFIAVSIMGGATYMQGLGVSDGETDETIVQSFSITDLTDTTHISTIDTHTYQVEYKVDADDNVDFEDDTLLDNVVGTFDVKRIDTNAEDDKIVKLQFNNTQVENNDVDASPWWTVEEKSDGDYNFAFTPSGGSTEYETTSVLVSPA